MTGGYAQQTSTPEGGLQTQPPQTGMHFKVLVVYYCGRLCIWSKTVDQIAIAIEFMHDMV